MEMSNKALVFTLAIVGLNMMSCEMFERKTSQERIVISAFGETLSLDKLSKRIPDVMSIEDSTLMAERIIEGWIREHVLLAEVEKNISEFNHDFEADVTAYRNALLVSHFESRYVASRIDGNVEENEIENFHNEHADLFLLQEHVVRALYVQLPGEETQLDSVRTWLEASDSLSIPKLEQWCIEHGAHFALDFDYWWFLSDLLDQIPMQIYRIEDQLRQRKVIEFTDDNKRYLLRILEHQFKDLPSPIGVARDRIVDLIIQARRRTLLEDLRDDLVKEAWAQGEIIRDSIPT
ncbi:MAG: hypothetical protein OSA04_01955 [Flavobacteriales bacterium]|nr:hypothetical protein [Flavobacteriales bacterium]